LGAADLERPDLHRLARRRADAEGLALVARLGQPFQQLLAVVAVLAGDVVDARAHGQGRVLGHGDDGQSLVDLQGAHPGDAVVLAPARAGGHCEGQLPLLVAFLVLQGRAAGDRRADQALAGAIGAHAGQQGLVDLAAVVDRELGA
jgi:hypothetical protein